MRKGKEMVRKKNAALQTVQDVVCANTGMSVDDLLNDRTPYPIEQLRQAAELIRDAIQAKKTIYIAGDYDVDGICASSILELGLRCVHAKTVVRLPKRFSEGYGLKKEMVEEFDDGQLLITVDNGITAMDAIQRAKEKTMTVIVTDHHLPALDEETKLPILPEADIVIDPNAIQNSAKFNGYCGAGLAFRLCRMLLGPKHWMIPRLLSLAAIATVADSVPLLYENRLIVKYGLQTMVDRRGNTKGLYAILCELDLDRYITETNIGFKLAPALNAPGRLRDDGAMDAFKLLTFEGSYAEAKEMAQALLEDNKKRKELSDAWTQKIIEKIEENHMESDYPLVIYEKNIPEGIIGIVAGRIAEKFHSPCFLLGESSTSGIAKGSSRSDGFCNLKELLDSNKDWLISYGGHAPAAGLKLHTGEIPEFRKALLRTLEGQRPEFIEKNECDLYIKANQIEATIEELQKYAPYGEGNPMPIFYLEDLTLVPVGTEYYKMISNGKGVKLLSPQLEAVSFDGAEEYENLHYPRHVSLLGTLSVHIFMDKKKNQMEYSKIYPSNSTVRTSPLAKALANRAVGRYQN